MAYDMYTRHNPAAFGVADDTHFCANIWKMKNLRRVLDAAGALDWSCKPGEWREGQPDEFRRSPDPKKVPGYKFCSNDGWWVQPEECLVLAVALEGVTEQQVLEADRTPQQKIWDSDLLEETSIAQMVADAQKFGEFCRRAAALGGFEVC
jgi:hypothetical protein